MRKKIQKIQKKLSKKTYQSNNYFKTKKQLNVTYKKFKNARKFAIHKITREIVKNYDIIVIENLQIQKMVNINTNNNISRYLLDASLQEIIRQLEYKAKWYGKILYKIDTYYASSQICSNCGYKNSLLKNLNIRNYICPNCHFKLDRDYNAAINICFEGVKQYMKEIKYQQFK